MRCQSNLKWSYVIVLDWRSTFLFYFIILFFERERKRERKKGRGRERERERGIENPKQASHY